MKLEWERIFWDNLSTYIGVIENYLIKVGGKRLKVETTLEKLPFKLNKGLTRKDYLEKGNYPIIDQGKKLIGGYTNREDLVISENLPLIIFGDHTRNIKFIDFNFALGADGVKLLNPCKLFEREYYYYCLFGCIIKGRDYGRHFKILKTKSICLPHPDDEKKSFQLQLKIVDFLKNLKNNSIKQQNFFNSEVEDRILLLQTKSLKGLNVKYELQVQTNLLTQLRQAILQEAVQGKLVSQDPNDEPASILLEKIKKEKEALILAKEIRKEKALPRISKQEMPYELPKGWEWSRLGEIIFKKPRNGFSPKGANKVTETKSLNLGATTTGKFLKDKIKYLDLEIPKDSYLWLKKGDILIQRSNSIEYVGMAAIYDAEDDEYVYPDLMMKIQTNQYISNEFLHKVLVSPNTRKYFKDNASGTSGNMPKINQGIVINTLIPLPPVAEQLRVVKKVKELFELCDDLEEQLKQSEANAGQLMQAVLQEAFGGE